MLICVVSSHVVLPEVGLAEPPAAPDSAFPPALPKSVGAFEMTSEGVGVDIAGLTDVATMLRFGFRCGGGGRLYSLYSWKLLSLLPRVIVTRDRAMGNFPSRGWVQTMALPEVRRTVPSNLETIKATCVGKREGVCRGRVILDEQVRGVTVVRVIVVQERLKVASRWRRRTVVSRMRRKCGLGSVASLSSGFGAWQVEKEKGLLSRAQKTPDIVRGVGERNSQSQATLESTDAQDCGDGVFR